MGGIVSRLGRAANLPLVLMARAPEPVPAAWQRRFGTGGMIAQFLIPAMAGRGSGASPCRFLAPSWRWCWSWR